jgi:hypothetical protein
MSGILCITLVTEWALGKKQKKTFDKTTIKFGQNG